MSAQAQNSNQSAPGQQVKVLPMPLYLGVFGALLFLLALNVGASLLPLGWFSMPITLLLTLAKAGLILTFFMHLINDSRMHAVIAITAVVFVVIFFGLTTLDLSSRGRVNQREGDEFFRAEQALITQAAIADSSVSTPASSNFPPALDPNAEPAAPAAAPAPAESEEAEGDDEADAGDEAAADEPAEAQDGDEAAEE